MRSIVLFVAIFLAACQADIETKNGDLWLGNQSAGQWPAELSLPNCQQCRLESETEYEPDGPITFHRLWGGSKLIAMTGRAVRPRFQLPLESGLLSVRIADASPDIKLLMEGRESVTLSAGQMVVLPVGDDNIHFYLLKIRRAEKQPISDHAELSQESPDLAIDFALTVE